MARNVIALITGMVLSIMAIFSIQMVNYQLFPLPSDLDPNDMASMTKHAATLPALAHWIVIISHIVGCIVGGYIISKIADHSLDKLSLGFGFFLMILGFVNIIRMPHPLWFSILDMLVYLPSAYLGYLIARKL
jgi:hypothetical protein